MSDSILYVFGWYTYKDGREYCFRYPADRRDDLHQDGKRVTVEVNTGWGKWVKRHGIVDWGGGNYRVIPAK